MCKSKTLVLLAVCVVASAFAGAVRADLTLGFENITNNDPGDAAIGETQMFVDIIDPGDNQVLFRFRNIGPEASSLADVYYDDGALLGIASIDNTPGSVEFSELATPHELPGGNSLNPPFVTTEGFSADSDPPVQPMGVNPGEELGITFDLIAGTAFADVIGNLNDGTLRIGIRVQGFDSGGSESFVSFIPAPAALLLGAVGLGIVAWARKRHWHEAGSGPARGTRDGPTG